MFKERYLSVSHNVSATIRRFWSLIGLFYKGWHVEKLNSYWIRTFSINFPVPKMNEISIKSYQYRETASLQRNTSKLSSASLLKSVTYQSNLPG